MSDLLAITVIQSSEAENHKCTPIFVYFTTEEETQELHKTWKPHEIADYSGAKTQTLLKYGDVRNLFVGLGKAATVDLNTIRKVISKLVDKLVELKLTEAIIFLDLDYLETVNSHLTGGLVVSTAANTLSQANYFFDKHITNPDAKRKKLTAVLFAVKQKNFNLESLTASVSEGLVLASATNFARDLANERSDVCTPAWMEIRARELVQIYQKENIFDIEVVSFEEMKKLGLNLFASVGQGASVPPRLVILRYRGDPQNPSNEIALVGKGITFDTGGLNLKPTGSIEEMYLDMSGSAVVLGVMSALPKLGVKKNIVGALCMAENAISHLAYFPSAIIKSYKGLTVEIGNTDAEGRLVLADALTYVQRIYKPGYVIDIATLTGACVVALGEYAAGLFTNDNQLRDALVASGENVFERTWPLPLFSEHGDEMKGTQSDLKNIGKGRSGGACTAAAFLKEFIEAPTKWAHLDIAGPGMTSEKRGHVPKGATGFGVQLLLNFIRSNK
jgi:leucyl aminopeptidase